MSLFREMSESDASKCAVPRVGETRSEYNILIVKRKENVKLDKKDVDGRIILKHMFKKQGVRMWT
jgi:hypothetical protein